MSGAGPAVRPRTATPKRPDPRGARPALLLALVSLAAGVAACERPGAPGAGLGENSTREVSMEWDRFVEAFVDGYCEGQPHAAADWGRHEHDGRFPDWSPAGLAAWQGWLEERRAAALAFDPETLDGARAFEREHLLAQLDGELFWLVDARWPQSNPIYYADAFSPSLYLTRPYAPLADRLRAFVRWAENLPRAAAEVRASLEPELPETFADLAVQYFGGLVTYLRDDVGALFASVDDRELRAGLDRATGGAVAALEGLSADLGARRAAGTPFALGPERFARMLSATERVETDLDELRAIAEQDLARNLAALRRACAELAPGVTVEECVGTVLADRPEDPVAAARRQVVELRRIVAAAGRVGIPAGGEEALVEEAPPFNRWNPAYIDIPGPFEKDLPSVYYIAPPDPAWSEEERRGYLLAEVDLLFISAHEVWPGHFLQFLHSNRAPSAVGRLFVGYAYAEGWAHYAEELMWEEGLGEGDPRVRVGQLLNALLRDVRFVSAIGLHTGSMTLAESERLFREKAFQSPAAARQQAARGTFDPAYLSYTMGKLMILRLREDWTAVNGGREALREFHDRFLSYGGPPIPLVRAAMLDGDAAARF